MKKIIVLFSFSLIIGSAFSAMAIDGYKEFKFGMNETEVTEILKSRYCEPIPGCVGAVYTPGVEQCLHCKEFPFGGKKIVAVLTFIDDKLSQIRLFPPKDMELAVKNVLTKKYNLNLKKEGSKSGLDFFGDGTVYFINAGEDRNATVVYEISDYATRVSQKSKKIKKIEALLEDEL